MYSEKPPGYNFKNFAKPLAGLFGNENGIYIVLKTF